MDRTLAVPSRNPKTSHLPPPTAHADKSTQTGPRKVVSAHPSHLPLHVALPTTPPCTGETLQEQKVLSRPHS